MARRSSFLVDELLQPPPPLQLPDDVILPLQGGDGGSGDDGARLNDSQTLPRVRLPFPLTLQSILSYTVDLLAAVDYEATPATSTQVPCTTPTRAYAPIRLRCVF
jgi:hypothetical protein